MNKSCRSLVNCLSSSVCVSQLEEQVSRLQREKNELQSRMEEDQEDMNELMKKHKAAVSQVTRHAQHVRISMYKNMDVATVTSAIDLFVDSCFEASSLAFCPLPSWFLHHSHGGTRGFPQSSLLLVRDQGAA